MSARKSEPASAGRHAGEAADLCGQGGAERALVNACGGRVEAFSAGIGHGSTLSLHLPARQHAGPDELEGSDE